MTINQVDIGSIPGLNLLHFVLSVIPIDTDRIEKNGLFSAVTKFRTLFSSFIDEFMVCIDICDSLLSCEAHSIFHIYFIQVYSI